jgi:hypothetical protein
MLLKTYLGYCSLDEPREVFGEDSYRFKVMMGVVVTGEPGDPTAEDYLEDYFEERHWVDEGMDEADTFQLKSVRVSTGVVFAYT